MAAASTSLFAFSNSTGPFTDIATLALILIAGVLMTEPWRWGGALLARDLDINSELFRWVKAVSTALVAGLIARMIIFPSGALADVTALARYSAFSGSVALFVLLPKGWPHGLRISAAVAGGALLLVLIELLALRASPSSL